jgi:hypothetical protein
LIKNAQSRDIYVLDFTKMVKLVCDALKIMYDLEHGFKGPKFTFWENLVFGEKGISWLDFDKEYELCILINDEFLK